MTAALFDIDGTLIDSVDLHARAWQEALAYFGRRVTFEEVRAQIGKGGDQLLQVFFSEDELARRGEAIDQYRGDLYKRKYMKKVRPFPEVRELFQALLGRGVRIALASSAKGDELQTYKAIARVDDLIEAETSADDAEHSKPHPDIFAAARARLGNPPLHDTFVVGDSPWDAVAAHRLGVRCIGMLCGGFAQADLLAAGCIELWRDPAELLARLDQSALLQSSPGGKI